MAEGGGLQDDELYLPRTVVNKLIKEMVPNIRVSNDARDLLLNCCSEFIHLLASEANEESEKQQKKVISPEHVLEALSTLGFPEYIEDVRAVHKEYKEQASKHRRRGKSRLERLGIPEEELLRQQQQLFEEARQQHLENDLLEQQRLQQAQAQSSPHTSLHTQSPSQSPPLTSSSSLVPQTSSSQPPPQPITTSSTNIQPVSSTPSLHTSSTSQPPSLLPANLQATANLLQSLTSQQAALSRAHSGQPALSLPQILPLSPAVLQAMQSGHTAGLLQASQTASLLQAARATELLRVQVAAQQASLAAQQQQLQLMQQQQKQGGGGEGEGRAEETTSFKEGEQQ